MILSESDHSRLRSRSIRRWRIEKLMNSLRRSSERSPRRQRDASPQRDVPIGGSVFPERIPAEMAHSLKEQKSYQVLAAELREAVGTGRTVHTWKVEAGAPNATIRRGFTKDSLPIGTEIVVGGYLTNNGRQRDRPQAHISGWKKKLWQASPISMLRTRKRSLGASYRRQGRRTVPPCGWRGFRPRPRASEMLHSQHPITGRAQQTRYWRNPPICTSKPSGSRMCRLVLVSP